MMKKYYSIILLITVLSLSASLGQETNGNGQIQILTLDNAIGKALENNNLVQISKNNTDLAKDQNTIGNAGYLPTISLNANSSYGNTNSTQQFLSQPDPIKFTGAQSLGYGGNVGLSYTIFGGLGSFYTHKKLKFNEQSFEVQERLQIESIILQTIQNYSQALQAQNNVDILKATMTVSKERYERSKLKFEMASINSIELLNAQVDFNTDSVNYINALANCNSAKYQLNQLMNEQSMSIDYRLSQEVAINERLNKDEVIQQARDNNAGVLNASYNLDISQAEANITRSTLLPRLTLNSSYNFNHNENDASFVAYTESSSITSNIQLSIPIFDGHKKTIQYQASQVRIENAKLQLQEEETKLIRDINVAYENYNKNRIISKMDETVIETANLNFEKSKDLFESGQINGTQYREAQLNLRKAKIQASNNTINLKLSEVELIRLSGQLIQ